MPAEASMLDRPVSEAVTRLVGRNLAAARRALGRDDAEALHAFRVALRRARTTLRAYRGWLPEVRRKDHRRLRRLSRATNAGRDAEVLLPLVDRLARELPPAERPHLGALRRRLKRAARATASDVDTLRADLRDVGRPLRRRLRGMQVSSIRFARALGELLETDVAALRRDLETIADSDAPEPCHVARLTVKRVRYLLEPVRRDVPETAALVRELQGLQTVLGDLHDLDVLLGLVRADVGATPDAPTGLRTMERSIGIRRAEILRTLRDEWIDPRGPILVNALDALAGRLLERATATGPAPPD